MGMGLYELKKELIFELRAENNKIDGDFERTSVTPQTQKGPKHEKYIPKVPVDDAKNHQWAAQSSRALDRTYETETKKTLQRVPVWYQPNTLQRLS